MWKYQELKDFDESETAVGLLNQLEEEHVDVEVIGYKVVMYPVINKSRTFILVRYKGWEGDEQK